MSEEVKNVSIDPLSTAASDQLAAETSSSKLPMDQHTSQIIGGEGTKEETLNVLESMDSSDAKEAMEALDTMSEDGFFAKYGRGEETPDEKKNDSSEDLGLLANTKNVQGESKKPDTPFSNPQLTPQGLEKQEENGLEVSRAPSSAPSLSSCLGTESLIASGCVYTILEQFFRPTLQNADTGEMRRENVADVLLVIAKQLTRIADAMDAKPATPSVDEGSTVRSNS